MVLIEMAIKFYIISTSTYERFEYNVFYLQVSVLCVTDHKWEKWDAKAVDDSSLSHAKTHVRCEIAFQNLAHVTLVNLPVDGALKKFAAFTVRPWRLESYCTQ